MRKQTKLWKTRDGTKIRICDMSDSHLRNTLAALKRRATYDADQAYIDAMVVAGTVSGDMAQLCADQAEAEAGNLTWEDCIPDIYHNMVAECERRGI